VARPKRVRRANEQLRVPEPYWAESYIGRSFAGKTDYQVAQQARRAGHNILIEGPTGPGKTTFVYAFAAKYGYRMYSIPSGGNLEPSQLFGKYVPDGEGSFRWQDGPVTTLVRQGGVLLIDEINFIPPQVASVLFGLVDRRREIVLMDKDGEVVRAHRPSRRSIRGEVVSQCWCDTPDGTVCQSKWVLVIAAMNPQYEGTRPLNKALHNRFGVKLYWGYDPMVERSMVPSKSLLDMATKLRAQVEAGAYTTPVSTNMLTEFQDHLLSMGREFALLMFVNAFPYSDRPSVTQTVKTYLDNIEDELAEYASPESRDAPDFSSMTDDEIRRWRLLAKPGDYDPEWGVMGKDWFFGAEEDDDDGDEDVD
jgi:MoxR-like ATPase